MDITTKNMRALLINVLLGVAIVAAVFAAIGGGWSIAKYTGFLPFKKAKKALVIEQTPITVENVKAIGELMTATWYDEMVVIVQKFSEGDSVVVRRVMEEDQIVEVENVEEVEKVEEVVEVEENKEEENEEVDNGKKKKKNKDKKKDKNKEQEQEQSKEQSKEQKKEQNTPQVRTSNPDELVIIQKVHGRIGINLKNMEPDALQFLEDGTVRITLPALECLDLIMNPTDTEVFEEKGNWDLDDLKKAIAPAEEEMKAKMMKDKSLFETARKSAADVVAQLFRAAGYENVEVIIPTNAIKLEIPSLEQ